MNTSTIYFLSLSGLTALTIYILRVIVSRDYKIRGALSISTAALQALVIFAFGGFPYIYLPSDWPVSYVRFPIRVFGLAILIIGLVVIATGIYRLGMLRACGMQTDALNESSYYQKTRNPQVVGCVLYVIGFIMLWPSWFALGWGLALIGILHVMVLTEEEHLLNTFGHDYEQYCDKVPRYLGLPKQHP